MAKTKTNAKKTAAKKKALHPHLSDGQLSIGLWTISILLLVFFSLIIAFFIQGPATAEEAAAPAAVPATAKKVAPTTAPAAEPVQESTTATSSVQIIDAEEEEVITKEKVAE